jgi:hypothetical protein
VGRKTLLGFQRSPRTGSPGPNGSLR